MQNTVTLLIPESAKKAKAELIEALGTENNPAQWMVFMEAVTKHLPEILSTGRPTKEAMQKSIIGQLGFSSWSEFIEAKDGLNWNISGWKAFRRAWSVVEKYNWLKNEKFTSSEVNQLYLKYKDLFPKTKEEYINLGEIEKANKAEKASKNIADLELKINETNKLFIQEQGKNQILSAQLADSQATILRLNNQLNNLDHQLKEAQKPKKPAPQLTRFQHFLAALGIQAHATKTK